MKLILIAACFAVCQSAKLNKGYLPPESAKTAGGNGEILQTPFRSVGADKSLPTRLPAGSYVNEFEGVVIDADAAGTRATHSGLGNSRVTYGSSDSKVGEAAFRESIANKQQEKPNKPTRPGHIGHLNHNLPNVAGVRQPVLSPGDNRIPVPESERFHAARDRTSNIVAYQNDIGITDFNYAFQTDNGISAAEIGKALDGVRSKGGYSYTGDDGQVYTISYTADEAGYRPEGSHIPTPPPIPVEILKALEQNAKDEAAGIVDDGSYDAKKYNTDHTKGNRPNDYNDKHNTFERRPAFDAISTINQNSQANKPNRDKNNGQNQLTNANLGYTVNDKQISNFSNIRNQYENQLDILTNNGFNNNGPISNFKELGGVQSSNDKNKSQNVPLSQQKLQDKNEVQDSLSGRPNSYQAPISAVQNQQPNQAAIQKQTLAQIIPNTYQSNSANQKQQTISKPENSFVNLNSFLSRPNLHQTQELVQGQQNLNKKGSIFQTQSQNSFNGNQQSFGSGITSTLNANRQQITTQNKPQNNLLSATFNNQANIFSKPTTSTSINQNQNEAANVGNIFSNPTQNKPADSFNAGSNQNQQLNSGSVFSSFGTTQARPSSYDASSTGTTNKQQGTGNSGSVFSSFGTTQARPSSYDASITGTTIKQQGSENSGSVFSSFGTTQARPSSYDASSTGTISKQQGTGNSGSVFSSFGTTQARPSSYDASSTGTTNKQQGTGNSGSVFSSFGTSQSGPSSYDTSNIGTTKEEQATGNSGSVFSSLGTTQARPSSYDASSTGTTNKQQATGSSGSVFSSFGTTQARPSSYDASNIGTINKQQATGNSGSVFSSFGTTQARPNSFEASISGTVQNQQQFGNLGNSFSHSPITQARPSAYDASISTTIQKQQPVTSVGNVLSSLTSTQARPSSYDVSFGGNQQLTNPGNTFSQATISEPQPTVTTSNEELTTLTDNDSPQQDQLKPGSQSQQFHLGDNKKFPNAGQSINTQYEGELYEYPKPDSKLENVGNVASVTSQPKPNSFSSFAGAVQQHQQPISDSKNNISANKQTQIIFNPGFTSGQFLNVNSQQAVTDNNGAMNSNLNTQSTANQGDIFSKLTTGLLGTNSYDASIGVSQHQQSNYNLGSQGHNLLNNFNTHQQNRGTFNLGVIGQSLLGSSQQTKDSNSASTNFANPAIFTEPKPHSTFQNKESANQQNFNLGIISTQFEHKNNQPTENNDNLHNTGLFNQFSSPTPASPNFESSSDQPSQNFDSHSSLSFTSNSDDVNKDNKLVAVSSSLNHNDNFESNFLHKKYSLRKQQQINQEAFLNFLHSKNVANAPVSTSSNDRNQLAVQSSESASLNSNHNNYQTSPVQSHSSTINFNGWSETEPFKAAAPSRTLTTPKDDVQENSGITQATISPFPSLLSSISKGSESTVNTVSQTNILPSQAIGSSSGVNSVEAQSQSNLGLNFGFGSTGQAVNIQNQGEIYQYPKPDSNLPVPTNAPTKPSQSNFEISSEINNSKQLEVKNPFQFPGSVPSPTALPVAEITEVKSESGPKRPRPSFSSNNCCFSTQNQDIEQNNENKDTDNIFSQTSTFHNAKEEFEGSKNQQGYDETGYHY